MDGHGTSPRGRCEGRPDPSEVSSPGKLSVFLISYNLIDQSYFNTDLEMRLGRKKFLFSSRNVLS
jgi:hypothetical protein